MDDTKKDLLQPTDDKAIRLAKTLIRSARFGALAVLDPKSGAPLASRVGVAADLDGTPVILVSTLAAHTAGLLADSRCSLLIGEPGKGDPLAHARISIACRAEKLARGTDEGDRVRRRYLNRHPKGALYADFADFAFFKLNPESASLNGGFARAYALEKAHLLTDSSATAGMAAVEQDAISHMNADHGEAINLYARHFAKAKEGKWVMTGIDAEGIDIASGDESRRIFFAKPLADAADMRKALVSMAEEARAAL